MRNMVLEYKGTGLYLVYGNSEGFDKTVCLHRLTWAQGWIQREGGDRGADPAGKSQMV